MEYLIYVLIGTPLVMSINIGIFYATLIKFGETVEWRPRLEFATDLIKKPHLNKWGFFLSI